VLEPELELVVGHSAGAAVALELARRRGGGLPVVGICPSLVAGRESHTGPLHRLLAPGFRSGFAARFAAGLVRHTGSLGGLLKTTGSRVPEPSKRLYRLLTSSPGHVNTTLSLFTRWDAREVERRLPRLDVPTLLLAGGADGWIPLADVERSVRLLPDARLRVLDGLGHLAHEEAPRRVLPEILEFVGRPRGGPGEGAARGHGAA
jgi:magnesium chelatase accessory protein